MRKKSPPPAPPEPQSCFSGSAAERVENICPRRRSNIAAWGEGGSCCLASLRPCNRGLFFRTLLTYLSSFLRRPVLLIVLGFVFDVLEPSLSVLSSQSLQSLCECDFFGGFFFALTGILAICYLGNNSSTFSKLQVFVQKVQVCFQK